MTYDREALLKEIEAEEGFRPWAYQDTKNLWTIGIGRLCDESRQAGLTKEEAYYLLGNDVDRVEKQLDQSIPWWRDLSDARQRALIGMVFQLGMAGVLKFQKMLAALKAGDWGEAYRQALDSKWAREDSPERAQRVAAMFL